MAVQRSKIGKLKNIAIRVTVVAVAYYSLSWQLTKHGTLTDLYDHLISQFSHTSGLLYLATAFLMMLLNWTLEAVKWKWLIRKSERITLFRSLKGVFTGISVGTFTPNRLGEFLGRSFILDRSHPWKVFFMTMIGSYAQLLATILFGAAGLLVFTFRYAGFSTGTAYLDILMGFFATVTVVFITLLFFNIDILDRLLGPWIRKRKPEFASYFHVISEYSALDLFIVLLFSMFRYLVFSLQFYLILRYFQLPFSLSDTLVFSSLSYLVMAVVPTIALSEIGVRGSASLFFFSYYFPAQQIDAASSIGLVSGTTLLWLINLAIPAILGTFFIHHLRVFRNDKTAAS